MGIHSHDCDRIVVKDCRHVFGGEFVGGVTNEEAGLANRTIAHNDASALVSSLDAWRSAVNVLDGRNHLCGTPWRADAGRWNVSIDEVGQRMQ